MHRWIDQPGELAAQLARWKGVEAVALDTEFIRERTWWPQLALVQIAVPGEAALLVDPAVPGMADAIRPVLQDPNVLKLMHSASEDLQALQRGAGALPEPMFDTQIAAALSGVGVGMGYQRMVETLLGITLPKTETRSDWLRRPLSASQLAYAADDVLHLHAVHAILRDRLNDQGRMAWLQEDCERMLANARDDAPDPWPHMAMRGAQFLDRDAQLRLSRLLRWREVQAIASDRPRGWILDNELAMALARKPPANLQGLQALLDAQPKAPRKLRSELWDALSAPGTDEDRDAPVAVPPDAKHKQQLRTLQDAVAAEAASLGIDPGVLASRRTLEALLDRAGTWPRALDGWRRPLLEPLFAPVLASRD